MGISPLLSRVRSYGWRQTLLLLWFLTHGSTSYNTNGRWRGEGERLDDVLGLVSGGGVILLLLAGLGC